MSEKPSMQKAVKISSINLRLLLKKLMKQNIGWKYFIALNI